MINKILLTVVLLMFNGCDEYRGLNFYTDKEWCRNNTTPGIALKDRKRSCLHDMILEERYQEDIEYCYKTLNDWIENWKKLDAKLIQKSKEQNKPLPSDFKTTEQILAEYSNPCDSIKQIQKFNKKLKDKQSANKT